MRVKNKLNILIFSAPDITQASGIIAYDLMKALNDYDSVDAYLVVRWSKHKEEENVISYLTDLENTYLKLVNKANKKLKLKIKTDTNYYFTDLDQTKKFINIKKLRKLINVVPDVIIGYFQGNFFKLIDLYLLQKEFNVPVLLVMADRVHLTGGCHYFWDCEGYKDSCNNCPAILDKKSKHIANNNMTYLKKIINEMNVSLITLSGQDYYYAKHSVLYKHKAIHKVLGGIDLSVFYPVKKREFLRKVYNIEEKDFVILFGAVNINEKRKGFSYLLNTVKQFANKSFKKNIVIVTIGKGEITSRLKDINLKHIHLGYISDYHKLAEIYNISDVLLSTTIQDSGPMMINQSLACGNPVVCFDIGVAQDIVINGKTGYKTNLYNTKGLVNGVSSILNNTNDETVEMRAACSRMAVNNFSKEISAKNIISIINEDL